MGRLFTIVDEEEKPKIMESTKKGQTKHVEYIPFKVTLIGVIISIFTVILTFLVVSLNGYLTGIWVFKMGLISLAFVVGYVHSQNCRKYRTEPIDMNFYKRAFVQSVGYTVGVFIVLIIWNIITK